MELYLIQRGANSMVNDDKTPKRKLILFIYSKTEFVLVLENKIEIKFSDMDDAKEYAKQNNIDLYFKGQTF